MASVRVGPIVLEANTLEEVAMAEEAVALLRVGVIKEKERAKLVYQIETLIENFVNQFITGASQLSVKLRKF